MGFFDKAKKFFGGHGVEVGFTRLERQEPGSVRFPVGDSVFKGNVVVRTSEPCTVLAHLYEVVVVRTGADGQEEEVVLASDRHDESTDIMGADISWPYELPAGESKEDSFLVHSIDIRQALRNFGFKDPGSSLEDPSLRFFVRFTADVKGSPFDPKAESDFQVVLG